MALLQKNLCISQNREIRKEHEMITNKVNKKCLALLPFATKKFSFKCKLAIYRNQTNPQTKKALAVPTVDQIKKWRQT